MAPWNSLKVILFFKGLYDSFKHFPKESFLLSFTFLFFFSPWTVDENSLFWMKSVEHIPSKEQPMESEQVWVLTAHLNQHTYPQDPPQISTRSCVELL